MGFSRFGGNGVSWTGGGRDSATGSGDVSLTGDGGDVTFGGGDVDGSDFG